MDLTVKDAPLDSSWMKIMGDEFEMDYMKNLSQFLKSEIGSGKVIYPKMEEVFEAFNLTSFDKVKVVIIGQDPYHGPNQAHGMSFSVKPGIKPPPSLVNIYKELESDLGIKRATHGHLTSWAKQGVLLLNNVLTVEKSRPASHKGRGWEEFTDAVVSKLNTQKQNLVFVLWGAHAQKKGCELDSNCHLIIKSPHPSPFSAHKGFFGSHVFSKINSYLLSVGKSEIDWNLA